MPVSHSSVVSYGEMISASISFSNTAVDVQSNVKFSFRLSKDLVVGGKILLRLPYFRNEALRYIHFTKCGKSKFVSTSEEDEIILTNTEFVLTSFTPCQILLKTSQTNIKPQGNISQKFDIKSNIVHSAPATILSSVSPL